MVGIYTEELAENWRSKGAEEAQAPVGVDMEDVIEARYVSGYIIWFRFEDGTNGEVDLSEELHGPIFEPPRDQTYFARLRVNPDTGTVGDHVKPSFFEPTRMLKGRSLGSVGACDASASDPMQGSAPSSD